MSKVPASVPPEAGVLATGPARSKHDRWLGTLGDLGAAAVVLLGGGLLQQLTFLSPAGGPPLLGPTPGPAGSGGLQGPMHTSSLIMFAALLGTAALMFVRRKWPMPVFIAAVAIFVLTALFGVPSLAPGIAAVIAAYAFAYRSPRKPVLILVSIALAGVIVLALAMTGWESLDTRVFQIGAALAIAAALGDSARSRQEYLLQVEDRAARAEHTREAEAQRRVSEERLRIARDLHDTVAHQISVINLHAGAASGYVTTRPEQAQSALLTIREAARGALTEIGSLLHYLRDEEQGSAPPPQHGLDDVKSLLERMRDSGLTITEHMEGDLARVTGNTGTVAYRVIQEGLTNAHKHGSSRTVDLRVRVGGSQLSIEIENDARPGTQSTDAGTGLGLIGLRERVAAAQGTVAITPSQGRFLLAVDLPLTPQEARPTP